MMERDRSVLSHAQAKHFYDRFGSKQDSQGFYEDRALAELVAHADLGQAHAVFELGIGTGRFARRLLAEHLPADARYIGMDISDTMLALARQSLVAYAGRMELILSQGDMRFPLADQSVDRVIATYVLDLLSATDIQQALAESRRVLKPGGQICLASLSQGVTLASRVVCRVWSSVFRWNAAWVGGCRPIQLRPYFDPAQWSLDYHQVRTQFAVPSEILIATPIP